MQPSIRTPLYRSVVDGLQMALVLAFIGVMLQGSASLRAMAPWAATAASNVCWFSTGAASALLAVVLALRRHGLMYSTGGTRQVVLPFPQFGGDAKQAAGAKSPPVTTMTVQEPDGVSHTFIVAGPRQGVGGSDTISKPPRAEGAAAPTPPLRSRDEHRLDAVRRTFWASTWPTHHDYKCVKEALELSGFKDVNDLHAYRVAMMLPGDLIGEALTFGFGDTVTREKLWGFIEKERDAITKAIADLAPDDMRATQLLGTEAELLMIFYLSQTAEKIAQEVNWAGQAAKPAWFLETATRCADRAEHVAQYAMDELPLETRVQYLENNLDFLLSTLDMLRQQDNRYDFASEGDMQHLQKRVAAAKREAARQ